mmetsp:Transcript_5344/g.10194  ORF Transcript_5344/g.10194 Transcript_5344/m.10194 type:complete len:96 (+) Transcript_5344:4569-4856(+)
MISQDASLYPLAVYQILVSFFTICNFDLVTEYHISHQSKADLGLEENDLSGTIPEWICNSSSLVELWLDCAGDEPKVSCDSDCCTKCCPDVSCSF